MNYYSKGLALEGHKRCYININMQCLPKAYKHSAMYSFVFRQGKQVEDNIS